MITQFSEAWHHVQKCPDPFTERQVGSEMVAQSEQVVGQVHAVIVLDCSQVWELQQVIPG